MPYAPVKIRKNATTTWNSFFSVFAILAKIGENFLAEQFTDIRVSHVHLGKLAGAFPNDIVSYKAKS